MEPNEKLKKLLTVKKKNAPQPGTSWTHPVKQSKVLEKVKAFLPKINEANNGLNVAESDDFEIKEVNVNDEESDESDVDFSNEEKPVVKVDVALFQYDDHSDTDISEEFSLSSDSELDDCHREKNEKIEKFKKFHLKMPGESNSKRSKRRLVQEIKQTI